MTGVPSIKGGAVGMLLDCRCLLGPTAARREGSKVRYHVTHHLVTTENGTYSALPIHDSHAAHAQAHSRPGPVAFNCFSLYQGPQIPQHKTSWIYTQSSDGVHVHMSLHNNNSIDNLHKCD
ncbi:hypothetical protein MPTK1_4g09500 [Marchantia polymorpha subsp. ruderalis]|uniref:Uncharacterized protein n=2 Tax=Marchantia polymorpha TaxID=3197 RepID=A0AAF6B845_MARPO|nr:hypothetical protein MARPO_0112s0055 [Marchantia polymorpha]BBN08179.1 hypothetical protein Mp_4g09500 [Marchantia polymorpha subsp. ruderalis]|eukprot:PTQ31413.1 hypothetical protein MARPO_0112s0055 [Marchantia polymorpha]